MSLFAGLPVTYLVTSFYWENLYAFGLGPKKGEDGVYHWAFPMRDRRLAGIGVEDIGRVAYASSRGARRTSPRPSGSPGSS